MNSNQVDPQFAMTIDGRAADADASFSVVNPATEEVISGAPNASEADLDLAVVSAGRAQKAWKLDDGARQVALRAFHGDLVRELDDLARLLTLEQGKPLQEARAEVQQAAEWLDYFATLDASTKFST